eukprot:SAG31_NODE_2640_length_5324_cov_5.437835_8_plen_86_part_00
MPVFLPPVGTSGGRTSGSNLVGKTRCCDELLVDPRILELVDGHLGAVFELSICVLMNIFPGEKPQVCVRSRMRRRADWWVNPAAR